MYEYITLFCGRNTDETLYEPQTIWGSIHTPESTKRHDASGCIYKSIVYVVQHQSQVSDD